MDHRSMSSSGLPRIIGLPTDQSDQGSSRVVEIEQLLLVRAARVYFKLGTRHEAGMSTAHATSFSSQLAERFTVIKKWSAAD